jgi:hypothetical protein
VRHLVPATRRLIKSLLLFRNERSGAEAFDSAHNNSAKPSIFVRVWNSSRRMEAVTDGRSTISLLAATAILSAILGSSYGTTFNGTCAAMRTRLSAVLNGGCPDSADPVTLQRLSGGRHSEPRQPFAFVCTNCGSLLDAAENMLANGVTGGLPGLARDRAGLAAGSRKKTPARAEARPSGLRLVTWSGSG